MSRARTDSTRQTLYLQTARIGRSNFIRKIYGRSIANRACGDSALNLAQRLAYLLSAERANSVQTEAEDEAMLVTQAYVEGEVLNVNSAAIE